MPYTATLRAGSGFYGWLTCEETFSCDVRLTVTLPLAEREDYARMAGAAPGQPVRFLVGEVSLQSVDTPEDAVWKRVHLYFPGGSNAPQLELQDMEWNPDSAQYESVGQPYAGSALRLTTGARDTVFVQMFGPAHDAEQWVANPAISVGLAAKWW